MDPKEIPNWAHNPKLRKIEKNVLIPRIAEEKINKELCFKEKRFFSDCAKEQGMKVVVNCKDALKAYEICSNAIWRNENFWKEMEREYLQRREKYRETGVSDIPSRRV